MQCWSVETKQEDRRSKIVIYGGQYFSAHCKGAIGSHFKVIESFNLLNSVKWWCSVSNRKLMFII